LTRVRVLQIYFLDNSDIAETAKPIKCNNKLYK